MGRKVYDTLTNQHGDIPEMGHNYRELQDTCARFWEVAILHAGWSPVWHPPAWRSRDPLGRIPWDREESWKAGVPEEWCAPSYRGHRWLIHIGSKFVVISSFIHKFVDCFSPFDICLKRHHPIFSAAAMCVLLNWLIFPPEDFSASGRKRNED